MLLRQDRRRHQIDHLFSFLHRLKGRPQGNLRLSVAHVSADQPVHDLPALHILFRILDGRQLVLRFLIGKHLLKFLLPDRIRAVLKALRVLSGRVKLHQLLSDLPYRRPHLCLGPVPFRSAQLVELRRLRVRTGVFLDPVQAGRRKIKVPAVGIFYFDIVLDDMVLLDFFDSPVNSQAMAFMNHIIPDGKFGKAADLFPLVMVPLPLFLLLFRSEHVAFGDHNEFDHRILEAFMELSVGHQDLSRLHRAGRILRTVCKKIIFS